MIGAADKLLEYLKMNLEDSYSIENEFPSYLFFLLKALFSERTTIFFTFFFRTTGGVQRRCSCSRQPKIYQTTRQSSARFNRNVFWGKTKLFLQKGSSRPLLYSCHQCLPLPRPGPRCSVGGASAPCSRRRAAPPCHSCGGMASTSLAALDTSRARANSRT